MANVPIENTNAETSFLDEDSGSDIQIKDVLFIILHNLHWFILCGLIGAGYAYWKVNGEERIYSSNASIMIKQGVSSGSESMRSSAVMNQMLGNNGFVSSINNEINIIQSATLMDSVVRNLGLNISYSYKTKIAKRNKTLYQDSPVTVSIDNLDENSYYSFIVIPKDSEHFVYSEMREDAQEKVVKFGEKIITPVGEVLVAEKWNYCNLIGVPVVVSIVPVSSISASLRSRLSVERDSDKNSIIRLSITDTSPARAADVLNVLIAVYNNDAIADQKKMLDYSYKFINGRIDQLYGDLDSLQERMVGFKVANVLLDTRSLGQAELSERSASNAEVKVLQAQISRINYLLDIVNEVSDDGILPVMPNAPSGTTGLIGKYNENSRKLSKYRESGMTENPATKKLASEQRDLLETMLNVLESDLTILQSQLDLAKTEGSLATSKFQAVPEKQLRIGSVEDMLRIRQQLYLNLLTKREEMLLERPKFEGMAKIVDAAKINDWPIAPNTKKRTTSGLLIGLLIPAAIIVLRRLLDTTVHRRIDVEKATKAPFLGEIPIKKDVEEHAVVVKENGRDSMSEAFRMVRSNLDYMRVRGSSSQVVLFTSFMVSSGKTFVSSNLATSFALGNKKVVLVDLDIRKGTMNKVFGKKAKFGVSNFLSGKVEDIEEIIHHDFTTKNLDLIFAGPVPPNPAELLLSDYLDEMVSDLRERYDYVFLDNVPLQVVADAEIVKRVADTTLFVIRADKTDKNLLKELDKLYRSKKFPNLSVVLNSVNFDKKHGYKYGYNYGYGYGYGYGYEYGYGYGNEDEEGKGGKKRRHRKSSDSAESPIDDKE